MSEALMYKKLLSSIEKRMKSFGKKLQPPCTEAELKKLQRQVKRELGCDLPDGYVEFLKQTDGLVWNGLVVYASHRTPIIGFTDRFVGGLIDSNKEWRDVEEFDNYLVFADDSMSFYVLNLADEAYEVLEREGLDQLMQFETFDELMVEALSATEVE
jgi:hypothetical protein